MQRQVRANGNRARNSLGALSAVHRRVLWVSYILFYASKPYLGVRILLLLLARSLGQLSESLTTLELCVLDHTCDEGDVSIAEMKM